MNASRVAIFVLAPTALLALLAVIWQAKTIQSLHANQLTLQQELRSALLVAWDKATTGNPEQGQKDRLELIKLRHEVRELRESLVEARAKHAPSLKEFVRPLLPSAPDGSMKFRAEWKGMETHASNTYVRTMRAVENGTNDYVRFLSLHTAAKASFSVGREDEARRFAEDALVLNEKHSRGDPNKSNGDVVHDANLVLGRIAAQEGRLEDAKRYLLAAGETSGSPVLGSFGPNMGLAKDLLERGEQAAVLEYFKKCGTFWRDERLDVWKKDVEAGRIPQF